jgi:hypoxanthine-guanine phosphoribosyltransferase
LKKELENPSDVIAKLREQIAPEYIGFTIPEVWVAGYGLDATGEDMRFLPHVVSIKS